jgi:hypothetical protein
MRLGLAISILVAAGGALAVVAAVSVASSGRRDGIAHAQTAPCPGATPAVASQPPPTPQPVAAVQSRVTMPETGSAGLLPGSRHPLALQAQPACAAATQTPGAASTATATPSITATATALSTTTPSASVPGIGGGGGIDVGGGGIGGY